MNEDIHIAICDDLPDDRLLIAQQIARYRDQKAYALTIEEYSTGEAFLASDLSQYDLVFMDIFMDGMNGMQTARRLLEVNRKVQLVFCSTSADFAAESYDLEALWYLVKPVEQEKLTRVLDKFFQSHTALATVTIKVGRMDKTLFVADILYVESADKKCLVHTRQEVFETSISLKELSRMLPQDAFVRPIRYALVALHSISNIPSNVLTLCDGTSIPISRAERHTMRKRFEQYKWNAMFGTKGF